MSTLELPRSSKTLVAVSAFSIVAAGVQVAHHEGASLLLVGLAFFLSGFVADAFTGLAHFGFDYVFPDRMPILGPIAREFREHHEYPTLDPSNYAENLTKGSYCSLPLSIVVFYLAGAHSLGGTWFAVIATLFGMSVWAFFFHQIHSYAHMGSILPPEELHGCIARIRLLSSTEQQVTEFSKLFETVPIPVPIRILQRSRIILNPATHNLHHVLFESDFSSVNGWSDPLLNLVLGPIARRKKAAFAAIQR
ncbi:hypothetical protein ACVIGA_000250 [Bradyrhizobium sp. USDA 3240]